eukprot:TRINITY_DN22167_c0_g2_i1.p1 TRINITY_DN22167_c0_g2~~TRINITY_DN22167_c0_g2_i1.p1  ORF type:complete len:129 (+),score=36.33 TRINITY_DN22167_c0_g2_i1:66-452(+)
MGVPCPVCSDVRSASSRSVSKNLPLAEQTKKRLEGIFKKMDQDGDNAITRDEAIKFWGGNFAKVNAMAMFKEVDSDISGVITKDEFMGFWQQVKDSGYTDHDIMEEIVELLHGGSWVDWKDGRSTGPT